MNTRNIRKIAAIGVGAMMLLGPIAAFADTTASTSASVTIMLQQIKALQAQIQALQAARTSLNTATTNVVGTLTLIRNLKQGMSGADVSALQAILAADPSIFPSGNITGFFGKLTAEAVKKYQKKHGLDAVGSVGPKTLRELNKDKDDLGLTVENASSTKDHDEDDNDHENNGKRLCIPPGHMIAPGWLKHNAMPVPTAAIPLCNQKGEDHRGDNNGNSTTTPALTSNASGSVAVGGQINDTAHLNLGNSPTGTISFKVYGPGDTSCATPLSPALAAVSVNGNGNYTSGNFTTTAVGTYRFVASYSGDSRNKPVTTNCSEASESVNVTAVADVTAPVISLVTASNITGSTTQITWTTNELSNSKIWVGATSPVNITGAPAVSDSALALNHSLSLSGLATSTTYFYVVGGADASANLATSSQGSFVTLSL